MSKTPSRVIWGNVTKEGKPVTNGDLYKVSKFGDGVYEIIFDEEFSTEPSVVATQIWPADDNKGGDTRDNVVLIYIKPGSFRLKTGDGRGREEARAFSFIAVGN